MAKKTPPKGGRKGGKRFPRTDLEAAVVYAKRLVSKTHIGPQPSSIILPGVFDSNGATGQVRASALKQFQLLQGTTKAYSATDLAKEIAAATPDDLPALLARACLGPSIFKSIFETFHGDTISTARIRQQAATLEVHPDSLDEFVRNVTASLRYAGLATETDGNWNFASAAEGAEHEVDPAATDAVETIDTEGTGSGSTGQVDDAEDATTEAGSKPKSTVTVNIAVDATLDSDKLEKQLKLLKKYGAI